MNGRTFSQNPRKRGKKATTPTPTTTIWEIILHKSLYLSSVGHFILSHFAVFLYENSWCLCDNDRLNYHVTSHGLRLATCPKVDGNGFISAVLERLYQNVTQLTVSTDKGEKYQTRTFQVVLNRSLSNVSLWLANQHQMLDGRLLRWVPNERLHSYTLWHFG